MEQQWRTLPEDALASAIFYRRNMYINLMFHNVTRLLSQEHMQQSLTQQAIFGMNLNQLVSALGLVARNFLTTLFFFFKTSYFKNTKNNICRRGERVRPLDIETMEDKENLACLG
jgi:hypothetical protein